MGYGISLFTAIASCAPTRFATYQPIHWMRGRLSFLNDQDADHVDVRHDIFLHNEASVREPEPDCAFD